MLLLRFANLYATGGSGSLTKFLNNLVNDQALPHVFKSHGYMRRAGMASSDLEL